MFRVDDRDVKRVKAHGMARLYCTNGISRSITKVVNMEDTVIGFLLVVSK